VAGPERDDAPRGVAQRSGPHVQRGRGRAHRRQLHAARLLGRRRPVSRRHPRQRAVRARSLQPRAGRRVARSRIDDLRARLDRRYRQPGEQAAGPAGPVPRRRHPRQLQLRSWYGRPQQGHRRERRDPAERDGEQRGQLARRGARAAMGHRACRAVGHRDARRVLRRLLLPRLRGAPRLRRAVLPGQAARRPGHALLRPRQRRLSARLGEHRHRELDPPLFAGHELENGGAPGPLSARPVGDRAPPRRQPPRPSPTAP